MTPEEMLNEMPLENFETFCKKNIGKITCTNDDAINIANRFGQQEYNRAIDEALAEIFHSELINLAPGVLEQNILKLKKPTL